MAKKLFEQAKELGVEAKGLQREQFITEYGAADGPPAVSPQALKLLRGEAFRCITHPPSFLLGQLSVYLLPRFSLLFQLDAFISPVAQ